MLPRAAHAQARADQREGEGLPNTGVYTANSEADDVIFKPVAMDELFDAMGRLLAEDGDAALI